jgi:hypothetical protein
MKNSFKILICICLMGVLHSCEKEIPYLGDDVDEQLVLVSYIEAGDNRVRCSLSSTASILNDDDIVYFTNANVRVKKNGNVLGNALSMGDGWYELEVDVLVGDVFSIEASQNGYESVSAETTVPAPPSNFESTELELIDDGYSGRYRASLSFDDPVGADFYQLLVYEDSPFAQPYPIGFSTTNPIFQNEDVFGESEWYYNNDGFFSDELFEGDRAEFEIDFYSGSGDVKIQVIRCSREFYLYQKSVIKYQQTSGDFFAQPVQIFSNVESGLGVVGAYAFSEVDPM